MYLLSVAAPPRKVKRCYRSGFDGTVGSRAGSSAMNTGMISIRDLGEADNLHPWNKRPVGERLADVAARHVAGE